MIATAYRFIRYDKVKSIGVVIGIVVSIFLIGQQIGVLSFLTGLMGGLVVTRGRILARSGLSIILQGMLMNFLNLMRGL